MSVELPELPYGYGDLEPVISKEIMELHHLKHHQGYVTNYNAAAEKFREAEKKGDVASMVSLFSALKFNGGGHLNHSIFWTILAPIEQGGGGSPEGALLEAIVRDFGSYEEFQKRFNAQTIAIQGSGWGWLGFCNATNKLKITTCANQDPLSTKSLVPLMGVDVWEHAYYMQYKNVRPEYVQAIWSILNWREIEKRFAKATA